MGSRARVKAFVVGAVAAATAASRGGQAVGFLLHGDGVFSKVGRQNDVCPGDRQRTRTPPGGCWWPHAYYSAVLLTTPACQAGTKRPISRRTLRPKGCIVCCSYRAPFHVQTCVEFRDDGWIRNSAEGWLCRLGAWTRRLTTYVQHIQAWGCGQRH